MVIRDTGKDENKQINTLRRVIMVIKDTGQVLLVREIYSHFHNGSKYYYQLRLAGD